MGRQLDEVDLKIAQIEDLDGNYVDLEFTEKYIEINYFCHALIIPAMILFIMALAVLAGFYPALLLSRFKPVLVLKGLLTERINRGGYWLRNILVLFQFTLCIVFLIGTMVVNRQV